MEDLAEDWGLTRVESLPNQAMVTFFFFFWVFAGEFTGWKCSGDFFGGPPEIPCDFFYIYNYIFF